MLDLPTRLDLPDLPEVKVGVGRSRYKYINIDDESRGDIVSTINRICAYGGRLVPGTFQRDKGENTYSCLVEIEYDPNARYKGDNAVLNKFINIILAWEKRGLDAPFIPLQKEFDYAYGKAEFREFVLLLALMGINIGINNDGRGAADITYEISSNEVEKIKAMNIPGISDEEEADLEYKETNEDDFFDEDGMRL